MGEFSGTRSTILSFSSLGYAPRRPEAAPARLLSALELVKLPPLMEETLGRTEITVGLIDGPVAISHPDLEAARVKTVGADSTTCAPSSGACAHGTFVAGVLAGKRGTGAPAICPGCTLLLRPIFGDVTTGTMRPLSASAQELGTAVSEIVAAGARIVNVSAAFREPSSIRSREIEDALALCRRRGVIVVAAAGNQATVGSTPITRHSWVIPVTACDLSGRPSVLSNFGASIGRRGVGAPGEGVRSLSPPAGTTVSGGTSVAAPFVTGAIALLWSVFPRASAVDLRLAVTQSYGLARRSIVPPLLDAWAAYHFLAARQRS